MESTCDSRFDPNYAAQLLLDIAHEQSVDQLLQKLVHRAVVRPNIAGVQIWLVAQGDICPSCPQRSRCPGQTRCLHLAAGGERRDSGFEVTAGRFGDPKARIPLGVGWVGQVALTGRQMVIQGLDEEQEIGRAHV